METERDGGREGRNEEEQSLGGDRGIPITLIAQVTQKQIKQLTIHQYMDILKKL